MHERSVSRARVALARTRLVAALCSFVVLTVIALGSATSAQANVYWGAYIGTQFTGTAPPYDMTPVLDFSHETRGLSIVSFGSPWENCASVPCSGYAFPSSAMTSIRNYGAIPMLSWSSEALQAPSYNSSFTLRDIIAGDYDTYIRSFAEQAAAWGHPFFLRFDWEMNGNWFPWSEDANGNSRGQYVQAWQHVHNIFTSVGATNATWVWCPNSDPTGYWAAIGSPLSEYYPGSSYVNWSCLDGYNYGTNPAGPWGWDTFSTVYNSTYTPIVDTIAPGKPMMLGEISSSEYGGSKSAWISNMFSELKTSYTAVRALVWYEAYQGSEDWPIETSSSSKSAFAAGIDDPRYEPNVYSGLTTSPIPAP